MISDKEITSKNLLLLLQENGWIVEVEMFGNYKISLPLKNNSILI